MFTRATGIRTFQPRCMSWSYRSRGRVPRIQIIANTTASTFTANQSERRQQRPAPASQEEDGHERAEDHDVHVLAQEEESEAHAAVLGVVARDQLVLRLGQVEGDALGLGHGAHEEEDEGHGLNQEEGVSCAWASTMSTRLKERASMTTGTRESPRESS